MEIRSARVAGIALPSARSGARGAAEVSAGCARGYKTRKAGLRKRSRALGNGKMVGAAMTKPQGIVIGGGGLAGLSRARALRQGVGPEIPVIVADPAFAVRPSRDQRASAIVAACRRQLRY